jgi:hypothetical protein
MNCCHTTWCYIPEEMFLYILKMDSLRVSKPLEYETIPVHGYGSFHVKWKDMFMPLWYQRMIDVKLFGTINGLVQCCILNPLYPNAIRSITISLFFLNMSIYMDYRNCQFSLNGVLNHNW